MALGHMAEILIIREMGRNGWETRYTVLAEEGQLELELEMPGAGEMTRGAPTASASARSSAETPGSPWSASR